MKNAFKVAIMFGGIGLHSISSMAQHSLEKCDFPFSDIDYPGVAHIPVDKWIVNRNYTAREYALSTYSMITDTLISADSCDVVICNGAKSYRSIFMNGLIPLNDIIKEELKFRTFELRDDSIFSIRKRVVYLTEIVWLDFIRGNKSTKYFKFHLNRSVYYFALENKKANKSTSMSDFISGARLIWLYLSPLHAPNVAYW